MYFDVAKSRAVSLGAFYETATVDACKQLFPKDRVLYEPKYLEVSFTPDVVILTDEKEPLAFLLLTHSGRIAGTHYKFWEMMGEMIDVKTTYSNDVKCIVLVFGTPEEWFSWLPVAFEIVFDDVIFFPRTGLNHLYSKYRGQLSKISQDPTYGEITTELTRSIRKCLKDKRRSKFSDLLKERSQKKEMMKFCDMYTTFYRSVMTMLKLTKEQRKIVANLWQKGPKDIAQIDKKDMTHYVLLTDIGVLRRVRKVHGFFYCLTEKVEDNFKYCPVSFETIDQVIDVLWKFHGEFLSKTLHQLRNIGEYRKRIVATKKATKNFTIKVSELGDLIRKCSLGNEIEGISEKNWIVEILCSVVNSFPNTILTDATKIYKNETKSNDRLFKTNYFNTMEFTPEQSIYIAKAFLTRLEKISVPSEEKLLLWLRKRKERQLINPHVSPLKALVYLALNNLPKDLKNRIVEIQGYPTYMLPQETWLSSILKKRKDVSSTAATTSVFFTIKLKNNKQIFVGIKTGHGGEKSHRRKEESAKGLSLKYNYVNGDFVERDELILVLLLDGDWTEIDQWILYNSGWDELLSPADLQEFLLGSIIEKYSH